MKKSLFILLLSSTLFSCISDEDRRLQTDQEFEAREMFEISFSLDEHLYFSFLPFEFYLDSAKVTTLPGCPSVSLNEDEKEITLEFGINTCANSPVNREGRMTIAYLYSEILQKDLRRVSYENYKAKNLLIEGTRFIVLEESAPDTKIFHDNLSNFLITHPNGSSSNVNFELIHTVNYQPDSTMLDANTIGGGFGRNWAGRRFDMQIEIPKSFNENCIAMGNFLSTGGQENWTIERTVEPDVNHRLVYQVDEECKTTANISLSDGRSVSLMQ